MLAKNIVKLNSNEVYEQIQKFLKKNEYRSKNTKTTYERHIKRFFEVTKNKGIQFLNKDDIQEITLDTFEDFIEYLHDHTELSNSTINNNVIAVKELLRYLHSKKLAVDVSYLGQIDRLPQTKNSYGILTIGETLRLAELAQQEREKGEIKRLLILFALDTCIRITAILNLKWSDFEVRGNEEEVLVKAIDKGNKDYRPKIAKWFYDELLTLKKDDCLNVFDISEESVKRMIKRLTIDKMNIPKERNIVFHSIRKCGITFHYKISGGDILQAKKAANHSNIQTTLDYIEPEEYGAIGAVSSAGKLDTELYRKVDLETLIEAIGMISDSNKLILNLKIQEVLNNKNIQ